MTQLTQTINNHTITVTAEAEQAATPRFISYSILIDDCFFAQEQEDTDRGRYSEEDCAKYAMRDTAEMLAAGMMRLVGCEWQIAQNAEYPVPDGYVPEFEEASNA